MWRYRPQSPTLPPGIVRQLRAHHQPVPAVPTRQEIAALVRAAGGAGNVAAYCAKLVDQICAWWPQVVAGKKTPAGAPVRVPAVMCPLRTALRGAGSPGRD
jgi:hypothetical protein